VAVTRYLLDTSAYIAAMRGHAAIQDSLRHADEIVACPVMIGELQAGFLKGAARKKNLETLTRFLDTPRVRVVAIDEPTAEKYAVIHDTLRKAGTPVPTNDLWLAATAMQHGLKVLTTDRHFERIVQIIAEVHGPDR
jgi:predicted nucleic acid-binding protein